MMFQWFSEHLMESCFAKIIQSILAGVIGSMILVLFLSGLLSAAAMQRILPWIIGFNGAMTGFMLVQKAGGNWSSRIQALSGIGAGLMLAVSVSLLVEGLAFYPLVNTPLPIIDLSLIFSVGAASSGLGGLLAAKHARLP